jgi:hypothetical protein
MRALAVVVVTLTGAAAVASAASPGSGLYGTVMRGPITPVCRTGVPCDAPAANLILTFEASQVTKTTRTDRRGRYRIALPAGIYAMRTSAKPFGRIPRPAKVHVRSGHFDRIMFTIDTGIR